MPYVKSIWPCYTPDLFWALSDKIKKIATRTSLEEDYVEYEIQTEQLPEGREGLWNFNALRHIKVGLDDWPEVIQKKAVSATLSLGHKALEEIKLADAPDTFTMFSGENILPLYVVQEPLVVTVHFRPALTENEMHLLPMSSIRAQGLMVNIKNEDKAFFVAASKLTALTWDGQCAHVNSATDSKDVEDYESLWNAVKMQSID
jgi:hypothetical protein